MKLNTPRQNGSFRIYYRGRAGKRNESVDSLDRDMETKEGMLNSNKKECHLENLNFPPSTQLTYSIDLTDRLTKERNPT